jgi:flagellar protein FlaG
MAANVGKIAPVTLPAQTNSRPQQDFEPDFGRIAAEAPAPEYRLVIEEDSTAGTFVYKTINRSTGEVVNQFPREELLRLREDPAYVAGSVLQTKA